MHLLHDIKSVMFNVNEKQHEVVYTVETCLDQDGNILYVDCPRWLHYGYDEINGFEKMFEGSGVDRMPAEILSHFLVIEKETEKKYAKE